MKVERIALMAAVLLLVAGCSDDVGTGPRAPAPPVTAAVPGGGIITETVPDADAHQFQAGGENWSIAVSRGGDGSVTSTSIVRNGLAFAVYDGYVAASSSGAVAAQVYDAGQLAYSSDLAVTREAFVMNQMAQDFPCQGELETFAAAGAMLTWRIAQLRQAPTTRNRFLAAVAAAGFFQATVSLYDCLNALRDRQEL